MNNYRVYLKDGSSSLVTDVTHILFTGLTFIFFCNNEFEKVGFKSEDVDSFGIFE